MMEEAYKNYEKITNEFQFENPIDDFILKTLKGELIEFEFDGGSDYRTLTQEEFINKIKTDDVFAKKWGVIVEVRELSLEERYSIMQSSIRTATLGKPTMYNHEYYDSKKIPKRSISLTYDNRTEVIYE